MVISHNMLALNANRQFNIINKNKAKSTEKLSSGYRINRAADDAAGLSISEKMRRQIRGLSQGVKNTEDGVSLCQVADGALSEVSAMLHRITELSVQSANETNSEQDRQYIQEEINQILQEIERISDTTTFNEKALFKEEENSQIVTDNSSSGTTVIPTTPATSASEELITQIQNSFQMTGTPNGIPVGTININATETGLVIDGEQISWNSVKTDGGDSLNIDNIAVGNYQFTYKGLDFCFAVTGGGKDELLKALDGASFRVNSTTTSVNAIEIIDSGLKVGSKTEAVLSHGKDLWKNKDGYGYAIIASETGLTVFDNWYDANDRISFSTISWSSLGIDDLDNVGGKTISFNDPESGFYFTTKIADGATKQNILDTFTSINGKIHYGQQGASETQNAYEGYMTQSGKYTIYKIDEKLFNMFGYTNKTDYLQGMSLSVEEKKDSDGKFYLAITAPNGTTKNVYYNASNKRYEFGNGSTTYIPVNSPYVSTDSRSMDIPSFYYVNYDLVSKEVYNTSYYAGNLKTKPIVPITPSDPTNPTIPDDPILANGAEELTVWIQSGCEAGQGMFLKIDRMDTTILGINDLDVSTVSGANHALDVVKDALEKVSSNRSKIGAQQNRLEHTIANELNVVENTTSAESRIRDTDMSKEMVAFSKDMILENVGQAMLAQANQSNQGVLSLLQ